MATVDWSELQNDLIEEIAKNIGSVEDFVSFSKVCPCWRLAAVKENWAAVPGLPQLPWLALADKHQGLKERAFFDFKRNKRFEIDTNIPQQLGRSWGSSLGWIVTITLDLEIHMINPLSRRKLRLPHLNTFKHMPRISDDTEVRDPSSLNPTHPHYIKPEWFMCYYISKALVCKKNHQLFVVVIYGELPYIAIARPGDESWSEVEGHPEMAIEDAVSFNGQLLALNHNGSLELFEFDWIRPPKSVTIVPKHSHLKYSGKSYLVDSMGDLLMVVRWINYYDEPAEFCYKTVGFDIYKLDFQNKKWMDLDNLGDMALFLGDSYSLSLSSTRLGCKGNAIYYTDDNFEQWDFPTKEYGGHDIGIFSLKDKDFRPLAHNLASDDLCSTVSCPFWMIPNFF